MWTPIAEIKEVMALIRGASEKVIEGAAATPGNSVGAARVVLELIIMALWVLLVFVVGIGGTIFWILMMVDCANRKFRKADEKIMWLIVIIASYLIGALIYYFVIKKKQ